MNNKQETLALLRAVSNGETTPEEALLQLKEAPFKDLDYAKIDLHRSIRQGASEVIYGAGKTSDQIIGILRAMEEHQLSNILVTRITKEKADAISSAGLVLDYHEDAQLGIGNPKPIQHVGNVVVCSGGTSDMKVSEEAALTAETMGSQVSRLYDVGVSGIHRLFSKIDILMDARAIVVVAGMEGALASVVGGLVDCPVIAVPTSVGYGANFGGLSALLSMLNSCASGCSVVNIDNGFGAGYLANMINHMEGIKG